MKSGFHTESQSEPFAKLSMDKRDWSVTEIVLLSVAGAWILTVLYVFIYKCVSRRREAKLERKVSGCVDLIHGNKFCEDHPVCTRYLSPPKEFTIEYGSDTPLELERTGNDMIITAKSADEKIDTVFGNRPLDPSRLINTVEFYVHFLPPGSEVMLGLTARPYPVFRMPGWHRESFGINSTTGNKHFNSYEGTQFARPLKTMDKVTITHYRKDGKIIVTINDKAMPPAYFFKFRGLKFPVYPTIGFKGPSIVRIREPNLLDYKRKLSEQPVISVPPRMPEPVAFHYI